MKPDEATPRASTDWVEIRVLGPLRVRSADGDLIRDKDWRTGKNADLLRWLALEVGRPVPVAALIDGLWPGVDDARARASLRTAVSHLRRVLGAQTIERSGPDVVLRAAWVDAATFRGMAEHVTYRRREGEPAALIAVAREADSLHLADVPTTETTPAAIRQHAEELAAMHRRLLGQAAEIALELGWMRDAVDYASRLLALDPVSELASRVLMLGHAGMGEVHHALREYERCRRVLADELGVDPSPQTRAVHLQVLQSGGRTPERATAPLVGRHAELEWLGTVLAGAGTAPQVAVLAGRTGSGRRRLVTAACRRAGLRLTRVETAADLPAAAAAGAAVLLWCPDTTADLPLLGRLLADPAGVVGTSTVVVAAPVPGDDAAWDALAAEHDARSTTVPPLLLEDVGRLAEHLLAGPVTPGLVEALVAESDGLPGEVETVVHRWARAGRLVGTQAGLALAPEADPAGDDPWGRRVLAGALPRLEGDALEALLIAAVLDGPLTPSLLAPLLPEGPGLPRVRATTALEQLVDLSVLQASPAGAVWWHPRLQDAARAWLRPSVRRRLHRRVAEQAPIPTAHRIGHWLQAGEQELACVAALQAAAEASARGDHAGARTHLLQVCSLGDLNEAATADRIELFEQLGDACAMLRLTDEAREAYSAALDLALADAVPDAGRLRRKLAGVSDPRVLEQVSDHATPEWSRALTGSPHASGPAVDRHLEATLLDAVAQADRTHDRRTGFHARVRLAGTVYLWRREFRSVHRVLEEAVALCSGPTDRLHADLVRWAPDVLLGKARDVREPLEKAGRIAAELGEERSGWRLLGLRMVVAHDLGDPAFEDLWRVVRDRVLTGTVDEVIPELSALGLRVCVEREELDLAHAMAQHLPFAGGPASPLLDQLARLAGAELATAMGDHRHAAEQLRAVVEDGPELGCTLLVPEAAARLVSLEAVHDPSAARVAFDVYDDIVGVALGGPREEFWRRMARAAVRAARGDHDGAADAAAQAGTLAHQHGLQVLAARARGERAAHVRGGLPRALSVSPHGPRHDGGSVDRTESAS